MPSVWEKHISISNSKYLHMKEVYIIYVIRPKRYFYMRDTFRLPSRRLVWGEVCRMFRLCFFVLLMLTSESSILIIVASVPVYSPATSLVCNHKWTTNCDNFRNFGTDHFEFPEVRWATKGILMVPSWTTISTCKESLDCDSGLLSGRYGIFIKRC